MSPKAPKDLAKPRGCHLCGQKSECRKCARCHIRAHPGCGAWAAEEECCDACRWPTRPLPPCALCGQPDPEGQPPLLREVVDEGLVVHSLCAQVARLHRKQHGGSWAALKEALDATATAEHPCRFCGTDVGRTVQCDKSVRCSHCHGQSAHVSCALRHGSTPDLHDATHIIKVICTQASERKRAPATTAAAAAMPTKRSSTTPNDRGIPSFFPSEARAPTAAESPRKKAKTTEAHPEEEEEAAAQAPHAEEEEAQLEGAAAQAPDAEAAAEQAPPDEEAVMSEARPRAIKKTKTVVAADAGTSSPAPPVAPAESAPPARATKKAAPVATKAPSRSKRTKAASIPSPTASAPAPAAPAPAAPAPAARARDRVSCMIPESSPEAIEQALAIAPDLMTREEVEQAIEDISIDYCCDILNWKDKCKEFDAQNQKLVAQNQQLVAHSDKLAASIRMNDALHRRMDPLFTQVQEIEAYIERPRDWYPGKPGGKDSTTATSDIEKRLEQLERQSGSDQQYKRLEQQYKRLEQQYKHLEQRLEAVSDSSRQPSGELDLGRRVDQQLADIERRLGDKVDAIFANYEVDTQALASASEHVERVREEMRKVAKEQLMLFATTVEQRARDAA
jgi:hypothetical protein